MELTVDLLRSPPVEALDIEIVERKGRGHPDSICDGLAEAFSLALSRSCRDRFGLVLHHNVDKALLFGGKARPAFGGGKVLEPFEVFIAGRATEEFKGADVAVREIGLDACRRWLGDRFHALDPAKDVKFHFLVRPGSADLVDLYQRQQRTGVWLSNDTSLGVGYAPLSELEKIVHEVEGHLNAPAIKQAHPEIGEDIKVMGVRHGDTVHLTVACALIGRFVDDIDDYAEKKRRLSDMVRHHAARHTDKRLAVAVNAADDLASQSVYLSVTGTSAEAGDDGEAGRGNRANGLITPYRPMTMESLAGKNPVTHVGKLYNLVAGLIAQRLVDEIPEVAGAEAYLVSQIGRPITDPWAADVRVRPAEGAEFKALRGRVEAIARGHIERMDTLWEDILGGALAFDRWPLLRPCRAAPASADPWARQRHAMVREIEAEARATASLVGKETFAPRVMAAMAKVPRHAFVPPSEQAMAYYNSPLPIGHGQTISQPYMVALMTDLLDIDENAVVLEVGTGSGYQAAVLAEIAKRVYTVEVVEPLAAQAAERLTQLGYTNVEARASDGYQGWPEHAPYDGIVVTAAAKDIPPPLVEQLRPGGRLVIPLDRGVLGQDLVVVEKDAAGATEERTVLPVAFVPLTRQGRGRS